MSTSTLPQTKPTPTTDFLPLKGTDHVEFYVGNARQSAYFYRAAFGMSLIAYAGPETGHRDRASYVLQQGKVRFVLTTALRPDSEIARHVHTHGDGVRAIALWVDDARKAWTETTSRGARSIQEPTEFSDSSRPSHHRQHRRLRRHHPHLRRSHPLRRPLLPRLPSHRP